LFVCFVVLVAFVCLCVCLLTVNVQQLVDWTCAVCLCGWFFVCLCACLFALLVCLFVALECQKTSALNKLKKNSH
jgi:hypothetical protein